MPLHGHKDSDPFSRPLHESNLLRSIAISLHPLKDTPYDLGWLLSSIFNVTPFLLRNIHVPRGRPVAGAPGEQVAQVAKEYLDSHGAVDDDTPVQAGAMVAVEDIVALLKLLPYTDAFEDQRSEVMDAASAYECFLLDLESTDEQRRGAISALCLAAYTLRKWVEYRFRHLLWNAVVQVLYGGDKNCAQVRTMKEGMNEAVRMLPIIVLRVGPLRYLIRDLNTYCTPFPDTETIPDGDCPIDIKPFTGPSDYGAGGLVRTKCQGRHLFHAACLEQHFGTLQEESLASCPMCREQL